MTIPTRWHKLSCETPQVVAVGDVPECRACGSSASVLLRRAAEEPGPSYSGIKLPPDAPIGQMDLWWPPCVPYTRNGAPRPKPGASSGDAASLEPQAPDSSLSEIYTSSLGKDRFRLLYLSGARGIHNPIHGNLVEYEQDNCPEYETVSYTWGGQDGDATPCKPAYFGEFWDVLFVTRNCWSLLQYLRPVMGTRVVWVDAICINQDNMQERGSQVSLMPQIYGDCMRVVIYPGDHVVSREEHRFRERIRLQAALPVADKARQLKIRGSILESRYIGRVWIIQELILASSALLAVENHDIYLDAGLLYTVANDQHESENPEREMLATFGQPWTMCESALYHGSEKPDIHGREWLAFMGQPWTMRDTTLYDGLKMTFLSQATDPRDKIFGILGILGANPTYSGITPAYSLSMRDCVVGAIGLTLLIGKEFWPLLNAQNSEVSPQYPSWMPSLDEIASWTDERSLDGGRDNEIEAEPDGWATVIRLEQREPIRRTLKSDPFDFEEVLKDPEPEDHQLLVIGSNLPWYQDATIDSDTAALTLRLVRVFETARRFVAEPKPNGCDQFCVEGPSAAAYFSSTGKLPELEQACHLFLAFHAQAFRPRENRHFAAPRYWTSDISLLFAAEADAPGTFKLLSCCQLDDAMLFSRSPLVSQSPPLLSKVTRVKHGVFSLFEVLYKTLNYNAREHSLHRGPSELERLSGIPSNKPNTPTVLDHISEATRFDMILPGQGTMAPGFLQLALAAARAQEPGTVTEEFRRAYAACLQSLSECFNPVLDEDCVWFTLSDHDSLRRFWADLLWHFSDFEGQEIWYLQYWDMIFPPWFDLQITEIETSRFNMGQWPEAGQDGESHRRDEHHNEMRSHYGLPQKQELTELQVPVRAKMPLEKVVMAIRETRLHWLLRYLLAFSEKVCEDAETLLERGPQPEDSNIYLHEWPKSLVGELGFVWRNEMVTFV